MPALDRNSNAVYTLLAIPDLESVSMNDLSFKMKLAGSTMPSTQRSYREARWWIDV
jgi:hypothetical protein